MAALDRVVKSATAALELAVLVFEANIAASDDLDRVDVRADLLGDPAVGSLRVLLLSGLHDDSVDSSERDPQPGALQCPLDVAVVAVFVVSAVLTLFAHH